MRNFIRLRCHRWNMAGAILLLFQSALSMPGAAAIPSLELVVGARIRAPVTSPLGHPVQAINDVIGTGEKAIVVEGETNSLVMFSLDGKSESRTPNTGPGGAMLANPVQMALNDHGELLVLDGQSPRIARFSVQGPSSTLVSVVKLRGVTGVTGICGFDGRTFVAGATLPIERSKIIHVIAADGGVNASFGESFGQPGEVSRLLYGASRLLCLSQERLIIVASKSYPEIRAYDQGGNLRWKQTLPDYHQISYKEPQPGQVEYTYPPDNLYDQSISIFTVAKGVIAVQVGRRVARQPDTSIKSIRTMFLSAVDGGPIGLQMDLPLVKASSAGRLFAIEQPGVLSILSFSMRER